MQRYTFSDKTLIPCQENPSIQDNEDSLTKCFGHFFYLSRKTFYFESSEGLRKHFSLFDKVPMKAFSISFTHRPFSFLPTHYPQTLKGIILPPLFNILRDCFQQPQDAIPPTLIDYRRNQPSFFLKPICSNDGIRPHLTNRL